LAHSRVVEIDGLDDVAREKELERPVKQNSYLAFQARQFAQIDATPENPGKQTAEFETKDLGAGCVVANYT
jgi:hypothetical protein